MRESNCRLAALTLICALNFAITLWLLMHRDGYPQDKFLNRAKRSVYDRAPTAVNDIQFKTADILARHKIMNTTVQLEAYKVRSRTNEWVSIGYSMFVKNSYGALYDFTPESIVAKIRILVDDQRSTLEIAAKRRYLNIVEAFIHLIPLQSATCATSFVNDGQSFHLKGDAYNFDELEIVLEVPCPENTLARSAFVERIARANNLRWKCVFSAAGQSILKNQITIKSDILQDVTIEGALFGDGSEVYITRNQLNLLSQKINTRLSIEEDYETDTKLSHDILNKLISLASINFRQVPIDEALGKMSRFRLTVNQRDLSPNFIEKELSNKLAVREYGNKKFISTTKDRQHEDSNSDDDSWNVGGGIGYGPFSFGASYGSATKNQNKWKNGDYSLNEQLNDLNWASRDSVKWEIEGRRVIPKMLHVALLNKAALVNDMVVSHKKHHIRNGQYKKPVTISTAEFVTGTQAAILSHEINEALSNKLRCKRKFIRSHEMVCESGSVMEKATKSGSNAYLPVKDHPMDSFSCQNIGIGDFLVRHADFTNRDVKCCRYKFIYDHAYTSC